MNKGDNLGEFLERGINERLVDQVRQEGVGGDEHVCARHQHGPQPTRQITKELTYLVVLRTSQDGEARQRTSCRPVKRGWNPPDAPPPRSALLQLSVCVLHKAIWRVCDDGLNGVWGGRSQPLQSIPTKERIGGRSEQRVEGSPGLPKGTVGHAAT